LLVLFDIHLSIHDNDNNDDYDGDDNNDNDGDDNDDNDDNDGDDNDDDDVLPSICIVLILIPVSS